MDPHGWWSSGVARLFAKYLSPVTRLVVELGTWQGLSARKILAAAPNASLITIDHFQGSAEHSANPLTAAMLPGLRERCQANLYDLRERVHIVQDVTVAGLARVAAAGLGDKVDLVYIDASHDTVSVLADIGAAREACPGAVLVGDDWLWPSVRVAVEQFARSEGLQVESDENGWCLPPRINAARFHLAINEPLRRGKSDVEFLPLVSCIMPTYGRPRFVDESAAMFLANDYPAKELVVLNDCPGQEYETCGRSIRVTNEPTRYSTLGEKRNACIEKSAGTIIQVWDDDDLYLPWRIRYSVAEMQRHATAFYRPAEFLAYWGETFLHDNYSVPWWVSHGFCAYERRLWDAVGKYPAASLGEDKLFFKSIHERLVKEFISYPIPRDDRFFILRGKSDYAHMSIAGGAGPLDTHPVKHKITPRDIQDSLLRELRDRHLEKWVQANPTPSTQGFNLSVCICVKNRSRLVDNHHERLMLPECIKAVVQAGENRNIEVVIVDFESTDWPLRDWIGEVCGELSVRVIQAAGDFSKGRGHNLAVGASRSDRILLLDADVLIPRDFLGKAIRIVDAGSAWFPVFQDLREDGTLGSWRDLTTGIAALPKSVYFAAGGVREFRSWGGEDDLFLDAVRRLVPIERGRVEGLQHIWHPEWARHVHFARPRQSDYYEAIRAAR